MSDLFRFFLPEPLETGRDYHLSEEESTHALKVLRMEPGAQLEVINGKGQRAQATLMGKTGKRAHVKLEDVYQASPAQEQLLTLAMAPTKAVDRVEWLVEKAVEMGVGKLIFLQTQRTERNRMRMDRLEKIALSALKQCKRLWLPELVEPTPLKSLPLGEQTYVAWLPEGQAPPLLWKAWDTTKPVQVLIGPEGDFTPEEVAYLMDSGAKPVSLGSGRLRTETAGLQVVAAHLTERNG